MDKHEQDYLQSSHYEKYLEQIKTGHGKQIGNTKKIDNIRSKNIYLQQHLKPSNIGNSKEKSSMIL